MIRKIGEQADRISGERTIYDVSWKELVSKNFVAGMSRTLGGLFVNIVLFLLIGSFLIQYIWPQLQPVVEDLQQTFQTLFQLEQTLNQGNYAGNLPLVGNSLQFDIHELGQPNLEPKSVELNANQLENLFFVNPTQNPLP